MSPDVPDLVYTILLVRNFGRICYHVILGIALFRTFQKWAKPYGFLPRYTYCSITLLTALFHAHMPSLRKLLAKDGLLSPNCLKPLGSLLIGTSSPGISLNCPAISVIMNEKLVFINVVILLLFCLQPSTSDEYSCCCISSSLKLYLAVHVVAFFFIPFWIKPQGIVSLPNLPLLM